MPHDPDWWREAVIYQIYPRSWADDDGDGVGDLRGIEGRLDHLVALGVDAVWISPFYPSPMADFGYDVADYTGVDPLFGTMADFDALLAAVHARGLRLILDFVPSHSSDAHSWFRAARASRDDPRRDWYVWRDPSPDGGLPNNWIGEFGGPAWTFDEATGQYYLHVFLPSQPSLNWRNGDVRAAMLGAMRFWFERGVDGFRVDAIEHAAPDPGMADHPPNPGWTPADGPARSLLNVHSAHQPDVFGIVRDMRALARRHAPERLLVGEAYGTHAQVMRYYGEDGDGFHLPFNFGLIRCDWTAGAVGALIEDYEAHLPPSAWPNWVLGNHDRARIATRAGSRQARVAAMLLLTLRGTPTIYQGDELGMENAEISPERIVDPWGLATPHLGRDPVRTPIPWCDGPGAGFTTGEPWLPIAVPPGGPVSRQSDDAGSMLALHRALLRLRRATPALARGGWSRRPAPPGVLAYARDHKGDVVHVALNFGGAPVALAMPGDTLLSTVADPRSGRLAADEGRVTRP